MRARVLAFLILPILAAAAGDSLLPQLTPEQNAEAARIVAAFKKDTRGPFYRIRWYCKDGTDWPPSPYPCGDRGGGVQHASLNDDAVKLARWNVDVGVILAGHDFTSFLDVERDHALLKELALTNYLERIDNGWIYRRAYGYRGSRQIEDEEKAGQALLARAFADPRWLERRLLLANSLVTAVPHGLPDSAVKRVRDLAKAVADADARFQTIRAKIHSAPDQRDVEAVEAYLADRKPPEAVANMIRELASLMRQEGASRTLSDRLPSMRKTVQEGPLSGAVQAFAEALASGDARKSYAAGGKLSDEIAKQVAASTDGKRNLDLLDFNALLQEYGFETAAPDAGLTRLERLKLLHTDMQYAYGAGLISQRQFDALDADLRELASSQEVGAGAYFDKVRYLARAAEWCRATAAREFGPVSARFAGFEPLAAGFVDDVLRGSPALALSRRLEGLMTDASRQAGLEHSIFGSSRSGGVFGLNPGAAQGKLLIWRATSAEPIDQSAIYVIPQTAADLKPMAGMLTLDSGNALSHAQLLAANLGIPNAVIPSSLLPELERRQGERIDFSVSRRGEVRLAPAPAQVASSAPDRRVRLDTARLDLSLRKLGPACRSGPRRFGRDRRPQGGQRGPAREGLSRVRRARLRNPVRHFRRAHRPAAVERRAFAP